MVLQVFILLVGFLLLVKGADWFVEGAAGIAKKLGIPSAHNRSYHCRHGHKHAGGGCKHNCSIAGERRNYNRKYRWKQYT